MIKVFLVEDEIIIRNGIKNSIDGNFLIAYNKKVGFKHRMWNRTSGVLFASIKRKEKDNL